MSPKLKLFLEVFGPIAVLCFAIFATGRTVDMVCVTHEPCTECNGVGGWELMPDGFTKDQRPNWEPCGACGGDGELKQDTTNQFLMIFVVYIIVLGVAYHRLRKVAIGKVSVSAGGNTEIIRKGTGDGGK